MKTSGITLKDMATILGVSISTVSKALSNSHEISDTTKEKVLRMADSLKYKPNFHASGLKNNRSFILGIILPTLKDDFFLEALNGITEESTSNNYKIMMYQSCNDLNKEKKYSDLLYESNIIDGLIFASTRKSFISSKDEHINNFVRKGLPVTYLNKKYDSRNICSLYGNGYDIGKDCVKSLLQKIESSSLAKGA